MSLCTLFIELLKAEFREKFRQARLGMFGPWLIKGVTFITAYQTVYFVMLWLLKDGMAESTSAAVGIVVLLVFEFGIRILFPPPAFIPYRVLLVMGIKKKILAYYWLFRSLFKSEASIGWICLSVLYLLLGQQWELATGVILLLHSTLYLLVQLLVMLSRVIGSIRRAFYWFGALISAGGIYGLAWLLLSNRNMDCFIRHWEWFVAGSFIHVLLTILIIRLLVNYVLFE